MKNVSTNNYCPRLAFHLSSGKRSSEKEAPLSKEEKRLYEILQKVSGKTIIGGCIRVAMSKGSNVAFRKIVSELKEQLTDVPGCLKDIVSTRGIELIKESHNR